MRRKLPFGVAFLFVFLVGVVAGYVAATTSAPKAPIYRPATASAPKAPIYRVATPRRYWELWLMCRMREVGDKSGWVYYIWQSTCSRFHWKTRRSELDRYRDSALKCYLDDMAGASNLDSVYFPYAANLTGKQGLSSSQWREWWQANGPTFRFTPELLKNYETWLSTRAPYKRGRQDWFQRVLEKERTRLGIR